MVTLTRIYTKGGEGRKKREPSIGEMAGMCKALIRKVVDLLNFLGLYRIKFNKIVGKVSLLKFSGNVPGKNCNMGNVS